MSTQVLSVRVDDEIKNKAQSIAKANGISLNAVINIKLREFIRDKKLDLGYSDDQMEFYEGQNFIDFEGTKADDVLTYLESIDG